MLQKAKNFKYLCYEISNENEKHIEQKLEKFAQILVILNNTFKSSLVQKFSKIKVHNTPALTILWYGSKILKTDCHQTR